ncbi:hypothetical protein Tco_0169409 [Tanacetum coccineum]
MGISLSNLMVKKVSSGNQTRFWDDAWIKDIGPLKFRFPRLFALEMNTNCLVADRWSLLNGVWQGIWAWRRQPHGRALDELSMLSSLISGLVLDMSREDIWSWSLDESGCFSVRSLCKIIQSNLLVIKIECSSFKWNSWVPQKVNICA